MEEDDIVAVWSERVRSASAEGRAVRIRGGGTKDWYGQTLEGEILDTRAYRGIIAYDPAELVITARAGTPLLEIEAALAEHDQMLAFSSRRTSVRRPPSAAASPRAFRGRAGRPWAPRATSCSAPS
ncbi:FAD/FMN-containing dehydrogenase [Paraburkholderia atlantica]